MTAHLPSCPRGARARLLAAAVVVGALLAAGRAHAQTTSPDRTDAQPGNPGARETAADTRPVSSRAEQIIEEQAARALTLKPYEQSGFERVIDVAEDLILTPPKVYPWFGSIYPGGLLALGVGLRQPYGDTGAFDVQAGWSLRNYTGVGGNLRLPEIAGRRVRAELHGQFINAPSVQFYGLGQDSAETVTHYRYRPTTGGATLTLAPVKPLLLGGGVDYIDIKTGAGARGTSIEQLFTQRTAPGLNTDPRYLRARAFAGIDWRESPGYTRRGGWYHAEWYDYRQDKGSGYSFQRLDAEVQQFIPILRNNWVLAFRGLVSTTETDAGEEVPFFLMPDLGGSSELRGYSSFRFRDRHRLLLTGEYRWAAGQFVDMALFVDAGKVVSQRSELDFKDLVPTYGIGVRFHAPQATMLRIELAKTREGIGLIFTAGQIF